MGTLPTKPLNQTSKDRIAITCNLCKSVVFSPLTKYKFVGLKT